MYKRQVLDTAQRNGRLRHCDLEPLLGRLQHTANILIEGNHFLNQIRSAEMRAREHGGTRLCVETRRDLELWKAFLGCAHSGIDIYLVYCTPDHIIHTDACEFGLDGYSLTTGLAWRGEVPLKDQQQKSINFLEFLACIAGIMLSIVKGEGAPGDCYLSLEDNTYGCASLTSQWTLNKPHTQLWHETSPSSWQTTHSATLASGFWERITK